MPTGIYKHNSCSEETKRKISSANKGRIFTEEWKKNLSNAHKGQVSWRKGKKFVDENISKEKRRIYKKNWNLANKDKVLKNGENYRIKNKEKLNERALVRYYENRQKILDSKRLKRYGINGDDFREIVEKQEHKCPICCRSIIKNLSVDHNHETGKIRGIICNRCNLIIGMSEDSPDILKRMVNYLETSL